MNLHDLYARVCAVRPDLAVPHLEHKPCWCGCGTRWILSRHLGSTHYPEDEDAAALILARWVEALPEHYCFTHGGGTGPSTQWWVAPAGKETWCVAVESTPIEALAAFYLGESK